VQKLPYLGLWQILIPFMLATAREGFSRRGEDANPPRVTTMRRSDTQVGHWRHEDWPFQNDRLIPPNVLEAVNFYQTHGLIHGRRQIIPADPEQTNILGNFLWEYRREPAECHGFSWRGRLLSKGHTEIECDRKVWLQVETLLRQHLPNPVITQDDTREPDLRSSGNNCCATQKR
jgi:hypothetical protein